MTPLELPVVDLADADAAARLRTALEQLGFAQLFSHGLDPTVRLELRAACDRFFGADLRDKLRYVHPEPAANRGYRAKGAEALSYSLGEASPPDLFESFNCVSMVWMVDYF